MNSANRFTNFFLVLVCTAKISIARGDHESPKNEKPLVVVVASYNNINWLVYNLSSIFIQDYSNYRVIYIDDCSTDRTGELVEKIVKESGKEGQFTLIRNRKRVGTLPNQYHAIHSCRDEEIVLILDGDDWFSHKNVFKKINEAYTSSNIWMTHGTLIEHPNGSTGWSIPIPERIVKANAFRTYRCPSHLRTFYTWLFKKIHRKDLCYGEDFFTMTGDQGMMFPMIEMAGERHAFIPEVLYVYNVANAINDNKVNPELQRNLEAYIRQMPPYQRLEKSPLDN